MSKKLPLSGQKKNLINLHPMEQTRPYVPKPPPIDYMRFTQQNPVYNDYS